MADEGMDVRVGPRGEILQKTNDVHVLKVLESSLSRFRGYPPRRVPFPLLERPVTRTAISAFISTFRLLCCELQTGLQVRVPRQDSPHQGSV